MLHAYYVDVTLFASLTRHALFMCLHLAHALCVLTDFIVCSTCLASRGAFSLQVVSMGQGREGESGHVTPNDAIKPGDLVYVKDPYGIGERR